MMNYIKNFVSAKIRNKDIEFLLFVLFFIYMTVYYFGRIFRLSPWYDELYTYYYFISNGPVYSAIHWPVPNNHIGYSVLSGIVHIFTQNGYISLRLVSCICALANLVLLFESCRLMFSKGYAMTVTALYSSFWLVNNLAVQGRGYTLSTTMFLMCLYCMLKILTAEETLLRYYIFWAIGLCMGFYVVTTSLYWVAPLCICAGICFLIFKKYRELLRLIIYSLYAAVGTALLYTIVWLAIGSNLLIKEEAAYAGQGHVKLIANHPFLAAKRGIDYMLATPYIQSVDSEGFMKRFGEHWVTLLGQLNELKAILYIGLILAVLFSVIFMAGKLLYKEKRGHAENIAEERLPGEIKEMGLVITSIFVPVMVVGTPLLVIFQHKLPYYRVFSFYGVTIAIALTYILYVLFGNLKPMLTYALPILLCVFAIAQLGSAYYNGSYGDRETAICTLMEECDLTGYSNVAVTDCNQQYMYKFVYGIENENTDIEASDAVIIEKSMLDENADFNWEFYYDYSSLPMEELKTMSVIYENDYYLLYARNH